MAVISTPHVVTAASNGIGESSEAGGHGTDAVIAAAIPNRGSTLQGEARWSTVWPQSLTNRVDGA
jgi:hypothetical protein